MTNQQGPTVDLEEAKKAIQKLSPNSLCLGGLLDLGGVVGGVVDKRVGAFLLGLFGVGPIGSLVGAGIAELVSKLLRRLLERWGIAKNETIECLRDIVNAAREASRYIDDEGLRDVVEEVASKWGWDVDTFRRFVKTAAGKSVTEDEVKKMIEEALEDIEEELENIKRNIEEKLRKVESKIEGSKIGIGIFFLNDVENGLLYGNFIVEGGVPRIKTLLGTAKNELVTDLIDVGRFREVAEGVFSRLVRDGRVVLIGPRGIGKSTLATYVAWRSLLGGLGSVVLDKSMDAVIRVDSLNPISAAKLNNLVEATGRRFVVIYDPSPIEAYIEPESMGETGYDIKSIMKTLKELLKIRNTWVIVVLPKELYDEVSKSEELRNILDEIKSYIIDMNLRDEEFLKEVIKKYSGCDDVSDDLVKGVMGFDSYTLVAKYAGIWLRERRCEIKEVNEALRESAGEPKLFFANYVWNTILGKSTDLARRVSVSLILHAAFGPIPEGITYITKAGIEGGGWKLIDRDRLAKSKLEDLREADLESIAKWLSTRHEDLIEETLEELVGLRGEGARKQYIGHGFEDFIKALDWGYEKALEEVRGLGREVKPEEVESNLLIFVSERLKNALKPYTNCWKRTALIIGHALAGYDSVPKPEDLPKDLLENVAKSLGDALNGCEIDDYLLIDNEISLLIWYLIKNNYVRDLTEAFIEKYDEVVDEVSRVRDTARGRGISGAEAFYGLGLASIIAKAVKSGKPIKSADADAALRLASFAMRFITSRDYVKSILHALEPLRGKAPQRYLELLALASDIENLDRNTVKHILNELNTIINNYGNSVKEYAPSMVYAIRAYSNLIGRYLLYFDREEVRDMAGRVVDILNELGRLSPSLGFIAWAFALAPALVHENVRELMERGLSVDVVSKVNKVNEVLEKLNKMRGNVRELMSDKVFMSYVESRSIRTDEENEGAVKMSIEAAILDAALFLKHALALYKLNNDEFDEAARLFNEVAKEDREIGVYENYLASRNWTLRVEAIKGSLVGDELVKKFQQLYEETFSKEHFRLTVIYLSYASLILSNYLVSLALINDVKKIHELLKEHWQVLETDYEVSVLTRLTLNALLSPKDKLGGELKYVLVVEPWELIVAFEDRIDSEFASSFIFRFMGLENAENACKSVMGSTGEENYKDAVLTAKGDSAAVEQLRRKLINDFREQILRIEKSSWFRGLGFDDNALVSEFKKLVSGLDCESLVQLLAPIDPRAQLAFMLYSLIDGNEELAKAHALMGVAYATEKLPARLLLEAYRACCDLKSESFRRAIARLFFYHV
ncbi:hypothetical protein B7L70_01765 [Vulcanisaeta sp. EB80]|uniref:ATP-binding protein n=1 Tax=Vulcanisaeta sp. EB80 TaxID=1650660 RepID=UPI0009C077A2|nr:ATP-binding protein [Vulcanisaeta sp. EB80]PLC68709.1 hypothetical protein B7L70_01765 [Vulcanisaeta sp. EB80]